MTKSYFLRLIVLIAMLFVFGCGKDKETEQTAVEEEHHEDETVVTITKKQFDAINVELGKIEEKNLTDLLRASGFLKVPPQNKANVTSPMGGVVKRILVKEGQYVRKGQTVAILSNQDLVKIQQDYLDARSQIEYAEAEYNRQKELSENNVAAKKTFQQAESLFKSLNAKMSSLSLQLSMVGIDAESLDADNIHTQISVHSPVKGNVSHIDVNIGTTVDPSNPLMDIVDNSQMHIDLFVFEQDLPKIKVGQEVNIALTNLPGKEYTGKIFAIGSAFQGESKSVPVHAYITGDKTGLIEGMNVTALVNITDNTVPAVPTTAIINSGGNDFIFVQTENPHHADEKVDDAGHKEDEHKDGEKHTEGEGEHAEEEHKGEGEEFSFEKIQVKTGVSESGFTQITPLKEIPENAVIVINGSYYLMAMLTNEGGHSH